MNSKIKAVEGVRGVACFMVFLSHLSLTFFPSLHAFTENHTSDRPIQDFIHNSPFTFFYSGKSAVYIFFVLSGYILTYVASKNNTYKLISMSFRRYPRLMIPAAVSCIFVYLSLTFFPIEKTMISDWVDNFGDLNYSFYGSVYSGVFESFFMGESSYNPVLWTMKIELIGSFLIFSLCFLRSKYSSLYLDFLLMFVFLFLLISKLLSVKLGLGLMAFIAGHFFYFYGRNIHPILLTIMFFSGLYLAGTHNTSSSYSTIISVLGWRSYQVGNFISGIFIVYSIIFNHTLNSFFSKKIFVFMGKVSFSVYLIHFPVIFTFGILFFNSLNIYFIYEMSAILASIATIVLTYIISIFYFSYVDHPGMILSKKIQGILFTSANYIKIQLISFIINDCRIKKIKI